tara:strand:+ start:2313 stop:2540 length:228 start_codon:yes stop_codon:yes gene_type:complete
MHNKQLLISIICHFIIECKKSGEIGSLDNEPLLEEEVNDYLDEILGKKYSNIHSLLKSNDYESKKEFKPIGFIHF